MLILDTDHISAIDRSTSAGLKLRERLTGTSRPFGLTIVSAEELFRGRLAQLARNKQATLLIAPYDRLQELIETMSWWRIFPWDARAAGILERLRKSRLVVSIMDLRIASIVLANNATLLSRNLRDFERVAELKVEDRLS